VSDGYRLDSPQPFQARFLAFYFPGWQAYVDGQAVDLKPEANSGLIMVAVPAGAHELYLRFADTPLRSAANSLSIATLAAMALITVWRAAKPLRSLARLLLPLPYGSAIFQRKDAETQRRKENQIESMEVLRMTAGVVGACLIGVFLLKLFVVDPYTDWFRRYSPPGQVIGVQHPLHINLGNRFWLLGYDLNRMQIAQGDILEVVLYWLAQRPTTTNYRSFVHLDAPTDQRTWAISDNFHPGDTTAQIELPTSTWDTAHYVRDEHRLFIPPAVPPVSFNLRVGLYDRETGERVPFTVVPGSRTETGDGPGDTIMLQTLQVTPGRGLRLEDVPNRADYRLGEDIHLLGYDWDAPATTLTLYWQASRPTAEEVVVFVHMLDGQGRLAWGADSPPLGGLYPLSQWTPATIVADPRPLAITGLMPGTYTLQVGMYYPTSLARLSATDGEGRPIPGDAIPLMTVALP
jgi:hypothetical protein